MVNRYPDGSMTPQVPFNYRSNAANIGVVMNVPLFAGFAIQNRVQETIALEEKARAMGFSLAELTGTAAPRKRSVAVAKYANPADASETWSGRGRKPRWFADALAAGRPESDLLV